MVRDKASVDVTPWGKASTDPCSVYPLLWHLLDTTAMSQALWDRFLTSNQRRSIARGLGVPEEQARSLIAFWAGLHDLGKLTPGFQQCAPYAYATVSGGLRRDVQAVERMSHARASMFCAYGLLAGLSYGGDALRVAEILGGHHGRFQQVDRVALGNDAFLAGLGGASWRALRGEYMEVVHQLLGAPEAPRPVDAPEAALVTGLVILADWLVSQEHYWQPKVISPSAGPAEHFRRATSEAAAVIDEAGLTRSEPRRLPFAALHGVQAPNPLQHSVMEELPAAARGAGILVVTAAPGDGKTETALEAERILSAAAGTSGLCFVLPTMATSDEMYKRIAAAVVRQFPQASATVTLTHSMAWLNDAYSDGDLTVRGRVATHDETLTPGEADWRSTRPGAWLRGAKRPLLAQFSVGTIDQALMTVLPVKHNMLRLLGLTGKTFIVDECHAYDPYMQVLLKRLLAWLGRFGCPVVLLSATLPSSVGDQLVRAYLEGAGRKRQELRGKSFRPPYPGWLFADAATGETTVMSEPRQVEHRTHRAAALRVDLQSVRHRTPEDESRLAVIEEQLQSLIREGGCAAVVCTTVADAQATYRHLRDRGELSVEKNELVLLHAQLPGDVRESRARTIVSRLGRTGDRPERMVVVATAVIEQSLDLDVDLLISDVAPMSQLLQRAGRCWRHEEFWCRHGRPGTGEGRPVWAGDGPRLVVLDSLDDDGEPPKHWGPVYAGYLLAATARQLAALDTGVINVPEDVQRLVEAVHVEDPVGAEQARLLEQRLLLQADTLAQQHVGEWAAIPVPHRVAGLHELHRDTVDEVKAATRLGAESVRVLCAFRQEDHRLTFDREGQIPLPEPVAGGQMQPAQVREVMRRTIPVRAGYLEGRGPEQEPPASWNDQPLLADLVLLVNETPGAVDEPVRVGKTAFLLDDELGLTRN